MAIYHFCAQVISRSQGRSSVAAAAYRAAMRLEDVRTGLVHDFSRKSDLINQAILLPVDAPETLSDRSTLWNMVEQNERRKDAQLAREVQIALPRELSPEQNWALIKDFVQHEFVDQGMIADVAFHRGHVGGEEQPHAHIMLTMRQVDRSGFGQKVRAWNDKGLLGAWREHWAAHCNIELAQAGLDVRIDHRTLEAQGINLEPQSKIGAKAAQASLARFAEHQAIARRNGERLLRDPGIALEALTQQQSTFTHQDIARFVNRHTADAAQFEQVYAAVKGAPELVYLGEDLQKRERYTTQAMLLLEKQLLERAQALAAHQAHALKTEVVAKVCAKAAYQSLSAQQREALIHLTQGQDIACVVGYAGTGKSYLLGVANEAWVAAGYQVKGMALSGIAAENLQGGSGIESRTVASYLWHWERGRDSLTSQDMVVLDEAGMLGSRQLAQVMEAVTQAGAKLCLIGDPEQLQAIEAGAAFRAISEQVGFVELTDIRRQQVAWQRQATRDFASTQTKAALQAYEQHAHVHTFDTQASAMQAMVERWDEVRSQAPETTQLMLAYTREEVKTLNEQARAIRQGQGELGENVFCETRRGERAFAVGDRVYFLRNENQSLGVKNGSLGTIEQIKGEQFTVQLDRPPSRPEEAPRVIQFDLKDYNDIDHGYAATVHKSQAVTVDRTQVLGSRYFDRHSTYVAMSRHRLSADLYVSREQFPQPEQAFDWMSRARAKDTSLDYGIERNPPDKTYGLDREIDLASQSKFDMTRSDQTPTVEATETIEQKKEREGEREKVSSQAVTARYERLMARQKSFDSFKAQFEARDLAKAEALARSVLPATEQKAWAMYDEYQRLGERLAAAGEHAPQYLRREVKQQFDAMAKDNTVIEALKQKAPEFSKALAARQEALAKERQKERSRGFELSL